MKKFLKLRFNLEADKFELNEWTNHRPCVPEDVPVVGNIPRHDNVYVLTGTGAKGTAWSQVIGELIAAQIAGKPSISPVYDEINESLSPKRYVNFLI